MAPQVIWAMPARLRRQELHQERQEEKGKADQAPNPTAGRRRPNVRARTVTTMCGLKRRMVRPSNGANGGDLPLRLGARVAVAPHQGQRPRRHDPSLPGHHRASAEVGQATAAENTAIMATPRVPRARGALARHTKVGRAWPARGGRPLGRVGVWRLAWCFGLNHYEHRRWQLCRFCLLPLRLSRFPTKVVPILAAAREGERRAGRPVARGRRWLRLG